MMNAPDQKAKLVYLARYENIRIGDSFVAVLKQ
jgi:hypothetical protein